MSQTLRIKRLKDKLGFVIWSVKRLLLIILWSKSTTPTETEKLSDDHSGHSKQPLLCM